MNPREWLQAHRYRFDAGPYWVYVWRLDDQGQPIGTRRFTSLHRAARVLREETLDQ